MPYSGTQRRNLELPSGRLELGGTPSDPAGVGSGALDSDPANLKETPCLFSTIYESERTRRSAVTPRRRRRRATELFSKVIDLRP